MNRQGCALHEQQCVGPSQNQTYAYHNQRSAASIAPHLSDQHTQLTRLKCARSPSQLHQRSMASFLSYVALLAALSLLSLLPSSLCQSLSFNLQTRNAGWSARSTMQVELLTRSTTVTTTDSRQLLIPPNSLILQGSTQPTNDVWLSSDRGSSWLLIAGVSNASGVSVRAGGGYADTSFAPASFGGYTVDPVSNAIYRIGGRLTATTCSSAVWMSTDGKSWVDQAAVGGVMYSPLRDEAVAVADHHDRLYIMGGRDCVTRANLNDVWMSADQGRSWRLQTATPGWTPRVAPFVLAVPGKASASDVLVLFTGVDATSDTNDVWASTNQGSSWQRMTDRAAFPSRNNVNAELTKAGLLVMTAGKHDHPDGRREYLNDVWVSADGGYNWGQCVEDAPFGDRRMPATVLDDVGRLLVMGGYDTSQSYNDVWRSSMSFDSYSAVAAACGVTIPACGPGLTCLPSDPTFRRIGSSVYCAALRDCASQPRINFDLQTQHAPWTGRAAMQVELMTRPVSYTSTRSGQSVTIAANSLVAQGSLALENDVWISSDHGSTWDLLSGVTSGGVSAASPFDGQSFEASDYGGFAVTNDSTIFRIGGRTSGSQSCSSSVWYSSDGKTWRNAVTATSRVWSPLRDETAAVADSAGNLFYLGGRLCGNSGTRLNDVWLSTDKGKNWAQRTAAASWTARVGLMAVAVRARATARDVIMVIGGVDQTPPRDLNDVWITTTQGSSWSRLTDRAAFPSRNNLNAEVTKAGMIVLTAGKHDHPDGRREYLNDVWVSADGGYTWAQCNENAPYEDRRVPATVLDETGRLLVLGGYDDQGTYYNDVYRSQVSFDDYTSLARICGVTIPACGPGLTCLPTDSSFQQQSDGSVTCAALRACAANPAPPTSIEFRLQCGSAPWSARSTMQVELYGRPTSYKSLTSGQMVSVAANSLILQGNQNFVENDVWLSSDRGQSWQLIAGVSHNGTNGRTAAASPYDVSSFTPDSSFGGFTVDSAFNIYRIGGSLADGQCTDAVFLSTDGKTWNNQITANSRRFSPLRDETVAVADSAGRLYLLGGRRCGDKARLNDVWMSSDKGKNWVRQTASAAWSARIAPFVLSQRNKGASTDVLLLFGGVDGSGDKNDIWYSTNQGVRWVAMTQTGRPHWSSRNNLNAEVTRAGLIVMTAGKHDHPDGRREYLNDVWVSGDGGWSWGQCAEDAAYSDRRVPSTVLDNEGYLYVMGGFDSQSVNYNDVWRSAVSFNNLKAVAAICNVQLPACGVGLYCLPGMTGYYKQPGRAPTCDALLACGESGGETGGSSGQAAGGDGSETTTTSGLSNWAIAAIVAVVLLGVSGGYCYYTRIHSRAAGAPSLPAVGSSSQPATDTASSNLSVSLLGGGGMDSGAVEAGNGGRERHS